jgi:hypothetical protein
MIKKLFLILLQIGILGNIYAQNQRTCGATEHLSQQIALQPSISQAMQAIEQHTHNYITNNTKKKRILVTIPVVFHVLYNTAAQNISDAQCLAQLDQLNLDFARLNTDAANTPAPFAALCATSDVQFCIAQRDPQNNPTTGINHIATSVSSFSTNNNIKFSASGGADAWPAGQYLNIWVGNLGGGLLGYAQFPGGSANTDGVVVGSNTVGSMLMPGTSAQYGLGRTATHEVGHWLNLFHIWGDDGGACTGSDQVTDTPNSEDANYGCPTYPLLDACATTAPGSMFMNYMDYVDDNCMNSFTIGQGARMQALFAVGGFRASLLTSQGCLPIIINPCSGTPSAGTVSSTKDTLCSGESSLLGLNGYTTGVSGITFQWQQSPNGTTGWTNIAGATTTSYTALSGLGVTWYRCVVTCANSGASANSAGKAIYNYSISGVNGDTVCSAGLVTLFASGVGTIKWYTATNLTTPVFVGNPYNVIVGGNTLFYVTSGTSSKYAVGPPNNTFSTSTASTTYTNGETFRAFTDLSVDTVFVYPTGTGLVNVQLQDSITNAIITTASITITAAQVNTKVAIVCNFACNANTTYHLIATGSTVPGLRRNNNGTQYPYTVPNIISILRAKAAQANRYYFFYDWKISANCTSALLPVNVAVGLLSMSAVSSGSSCNGSASGIVTATTTSGVGPFSYSLNGGTAVVSNIFNGLIPGTYTIQATDANGCTGSATSNVVAGSSMVLNATATNVLCVNGITGTINPLATGGTAAYSYTVNGLAPATNYSAGVYIVVATDANGCTASSIVNITQPSPLNISANGASLLCAGSGANLNPVSTGGTPTYSYLVNGIAMGSNYPAGTYTIQTTDANGCTAATSVTVIEPPLLILLASATASAVAPCTGTLTANGSGGIAPLQFNLNSGANQSSNVFTGLCIGTYTVGVMDANGCTRSYVATVGEAPLTINNLTLDGNINVFPNPNNGIVNITIDNANVLGELQLKVCNVIGQQVYFSKINNIENKLEFKVDLGAVSSGMYTLIISDANNRKYIKKIIIEK